MINIIIGMILWQLLIFIVYIATKEDEEKCVIFGCGVFTIITFTILSIYRYIHLFISKKRYNLYQFFGNVMDSKCGNEYDKWIGNYYMSTNVAKQFRKVDKEEKPINYCIRLLRYGKEFKSSPYKSEILTQKKIDNGVGAMSKEFIQKFFLTK